MDFGDAARKQKREQEKRRLDAKRKLQKQQEAEQEAAQRDREREERRAVREAEEREAKAKAAEEALRNDGVHFVQTLRPVPTLRDDDKLLLPPAALELLEQQNALAVGTPLTFQVSVAAGVGADTMTHAGVAEFTAEDGTVGIPPKVALCLTKASGLEALEQVGNIIVRYRKLEHSQKCEATVQPRGLGFHTDGQQVVNIDLQKVLEKTLQTHSTLTEGDWLPVRYEGTAYELVVRTLLPEPALCLLNTDLEVNMLPSEHAEAEVLAKEAAERAQAERERRKVEREDAKRQAAAQKAAALSAEPPEGTAGAVKFVIRLPEGGNRSRRILKTEQLQHLLDWVESDWEHTQVEVGKYKLVQSWPGHRREFGGAESSETLQALGLNGRQEALFLQRQGQFVEEEDEAPIEDSVVSVPEVKGPSLDPKGLWGDAERALRERSAQEEGSTPTAAARNEPELERVQGKDLVEIFHLLQAGGVAPQQAASASQKWGAQIRELMGMGFTQFGSMVEMLDRYNGRVLRVANALAEMDPMNVEDSNTVPAPAAAPPPVPMQDTVMSTPAPTPSDNAGSQWDKELAELAGMGFVDTPRNVELLAKYQGRLERVVNILCGAD